MRFSAPDPVLLQQEIAATRTRLAAAVRAGDPRRIIDAASDLGGMLTTARRQDEAARMLELHMHHAEAQAHEEPVGWFWNAYATALQYSGRRERGEVFFARAITIARAGGWRRLEALALHHWARSLVEQARLPEAEARFSEALQIRVELDEPAQASSRRALAALATMRAGSGPPPASGGGGA